MQPGAAKKTKWLWVLLGLAGSCFACTAGGMVLALLGVIAADEPAPGVAATAPASEASAPDGFALEVPASFKPNGEGRWLHVTRDGSSELSVELLHLPALPGLEAPETRLAELWRTRLGADWEGVQAQPFVFRRFVSNGAKAHFTGAELRTKEGRQLSFVSLYLVEAGDRLEPLVFIQQYRDPTGSLAGLDMMAGFSWRTSHAAVESVLAGVRGSPVGAPLVSDEEVTGQWVYGSTSTAQWLHTVTGSTSMTAVAYAVEYGFDDDHRFTYRFNGASGQVGQLQFGTDRDEGTWKVEHDLLLLEGASGKTRKYLVVGAARAPDGKRTLLLVGEGRFTAAPFAAVATGELFVEAP